MNSIDQHFEEFKKTWISTIAQTDAYVHTLKLLNSFLTVFGGSNLNNLDAY